MSKADYLLGHGERELQRLALQARLLAAGTERVLRGTGLGAGMSVLDIGAGTGDSALLAAELVGPSGSVLGIDREESVLEQARARTKARGLANVYYETATLETLPEGQIFDAVIGRYVLMWQADPVAFLRRAAARVRPGGILAFIEPTLLTRANGGESWSNPAVPLFEETRDLFITALDRSGLNRCNGATLVPMFHEADLPEPTLLRDVPVMGPNSLAVEWLCLTFQSLLPTLERLGVTSAAAVGGLDALATRMQAEVSAAHSQLRVADVVGAWTKIAGG